MSKSFLIYGANGYTASLTARMAVERGMKPILAGRSPEKFAALAKELGLESRAFSLEDKAAASRALNDVFVVLHGAGPFSHTYRAMADACLASKTHYLDITGEIEVYEGLAARTAEAAKVGIMLMPGVGFDIVPSDCLAAHLKRRLPTATHLSLGFQGLGRLSRGTATTMAENMHRGGAVRPGNSRKAYPSTIRLFRSLVAVFILGMLFDQEPGGIITELPFIALRR
ncbi:MAG: saccharopine dehydrogenase NADP-binding domain-containing protein [Planctomycetota bacterium]